MASFGWKRKVGEKVSRSVVQHFEAEDEDKAQKEGVDWQHAMKRRKDILLEDCAAKSKRLKDEGAHLAEQGRHREAVKKWDEAIHLSPEDPALYEMKSQVLTILQEAFPAVTAAETAVKLRPLWWEGWQTLGRAQLNLGEVDLAVRSFQVAVHQRPSEPNLWRDDLAWARRLQRQRRAAAEQLRREEDETRRRILDAPELQRDYDFESDEVLAACEAVARRQTRLEELRRSAVVVDAQGNVREVGWVGLGEGSELGAGDGGLDAASKEQFVKARGR